MRPEVDSEAALLAAYATAGPEERTELAGELFARHYERVARWCYRFTGERESAADLAQDVFVKAHRHLAAFHGNAQFSTWLYSIARNEWLSRLQKRRGRPLEEDPEVLVDVPSEAESPQDGVERSSRDQWLKRFLVDTLDETERCVFTLHYGDEMPLDAVTRLLRLENTSGAKAYIVSAKRKLARAVPRLRARGLVP